MIETHEPEQAWGLYVGRRGLEVRAGRHLGVSMSLPLLSWVASLLGVMGSFPYWGGVGH